MRKSRLVLVGVAVAAAAATGTAFTAGNTFNPTTDVAGYGESTVTGATVTNIHYTLDTDPSKIAEVDFTVTEDVTAAHATAVLKDASATPVTLATSTCDATTLHAITCALSTPVAISDLATTALTVVQ
jgi:hypothetical protein